MLNLKRFAAGIILRGANPVDHDEDLDDLDDYVIERVTRMLTLMISAHKHFTNSLDISNRRLSFFDDNTIYGPFRLWGEL